MAISRGEKLGIAGALAGAAMLGTANYSLIETIYEHKRITNSERPMRAKNILTKEEVEANRTNVCRTETKTLVYQTGSIMGTVLNHPKIVDEYELRCDVRLQDSAARALPETNDDHWGRHAPEGLTITQQLDYFTPIHPWEKIVEERYLRRIPKPHTFTENLEQSSDLALGLSGGLFSFAAVINGIVTRKKRKIREAQEKKELEQIQEKMKVVYRIDESAGHREPAPNRKNLEITKEVLLGLQATDVPRFNEYFRALEAKLEGKKDYAKGILWEEFFGGLKEEELPILLAELQEAEEQLQAERKKDKFIALVTP